MALIGHFNRTRDGYAGRLRTLFLDVELVLVEADHDDSRNAPDYRVHRHDDEGPEVGAGWKRMGEKAGEFVTLLIDDPKLAQPIRANLFQSGDDTSVWTLHWSRPRQRNGWG